MHKMVVTFKHVKVEHKLNNLKLDWFPISDSTPTYICPILQSWRSTTLSEFPPPSTKKQMAALTCETLMSGCGWKNGSPMQASLTARVKANQLY